MKYFIVLAVLIPFTLFSQTKIYKGERISSNELVYSISAQKVERMTSSMWGTDMLFMRGNKVYGDSFRSNCLYTIKGNKIYRGDSDSVFDVLYEIENDQFFLASSGALRKCLFTFSNNQIFVGDSRSSFDCIFSLEMDQNVANSLLIGFLCLAPY